MPQSIGTPALRGGFLALVLALPAVDIAAYRRNPHEMSMREASAWTAGWIGVALLFGAGLLCAGGRILAGHDVETHPEKNPGPKLFGNFFPAERRPIGAGTPS